MSKSRTSSRRKWVCTMGSSGETPEQQESVSAAVPPVFPQGCILWRPVNWLRWGFKLPPRGCFLRHCFKVIFRQEFSSFDNGHFQSINPIGCYKKLPKWWAIGKEIIFSRIMRLWEACIWSSRWTVATVKPQEITQSLFSPTGRIAQCA